MSATGLNLEGITPVRRGHNKHLFWKTVTNYRQIKGSGASGGARRSPLPGRCAGHAQLLTVVTDRPLLVATDALTPTEALEG